MASSVKNPWWKKSGTDNKPVKAWTPDPNRYHQPDMKQEMLLGGSAFGVAMIPRANNDGTSRGFDAGRAGVVIIDPGKEGGGIAVDPSMMDNDVIQDALNRVGGQVGSDDEDAQNNAFAVFQIVAQRGAETDPDRAVVASEADEQRPVRRRQQQNRRPTQQHQQNSYQQQERLSQEPVDDVVDQGGYEAEPEVMAPMADPPPARTVQPRRPSQQHPAPQAGMAKEAGSEEGVHMSQAQASALIQQLLSIAGGAPQQQPVRAAAPAPAPRPAARPATQAQPARRIIRRAAPPPPPPPEPQYEEPEQELEPEINEYGGQIEEPDYPLAEQQYEEQYEEVVEEAAPPPPQRRAPVRAPQHQLGRHGTGRPAPTVQRRPAPARAVAPQPSAQDSHAGLEIPFLNGEGPQKPTKRAIFDMGRNAGTQQARYHEIVEGAGCLILVYDTRYDEGSQFMPPNRGNSDPIVVSVPHLSKRFTAMSMGIQFNLGSLDFVVLIVDPPRMDVAQDEVQLPAGVDNDMNQQPM